MAFPQMLAMFWNVSSTARTRYAIAAILTIVALFTLRAFSDEGVRVAATVGNAAKSPTVVSVSPALSPITVVRNSSQAATLSIYDADSPGSQVSYTVTVSSWAVVPHNGTLTLAADGTAQLDFTFYSPSYKARLVPVTITLDDLSWAPVSVKTVDFYVY